ncbi:MAG: sarcosine oxidase subunit delta [Alphaproteobacteria bacterium]|nr:sarcosine oxidase subunit delta [Alphaproteobacteria bacterium]
MHLVPCPWCGERHESEFAYAGEKKSPRPLDAGSLADDVWIDYVIGRANPRGVTREKWWHVRGCGLMFSIERDTRSHEFVAGSAEAPR